MRNPLICLGPWYSFIYANNYNNNNNIGIYVITSMALIILVLPMEQLASYTCFLNFQNGVKSLKQKHGY